LGDGERINRRGREVKEAPDLKNGATKLTKGTEKTIGFQESLG
jgi:hypothetical protein